MRTVEVPLVTMEAIIERISQISSLISIAQTELEATHENSGGTYTAYQLAAILQVADDALLQHGWSGLRRLIGLTDEDD